MHQNGAKKSNCTKMVQRKTKYRSNKPKMHQNSAFVVGMDIEIVISSNKPNMILISPTVLKPRSHKG